MMWYHFFVLIFSIIIVFLYRTDFWNNKMPFKREDLEYQPEYIPKAGDVMLSRNSYIVSLFSWVTHVANIYEDTNGEVMIFNLTMKGFQKKSWSDFVKEYDGIIMIRPLKGELTDVSKLVLRENIEKQNDKSFDVMLFFSVLRQKIVSKIYKHSSSCVEATTQILEPLKVVGDKPSLIPYDLSSRGQGLKPEWYGNEILIKA